MNETDQLVTENNLPLPTYLKGMWVRRAGAIK